jgi:hypothetical protein
MHDLIPIDAILPGTLTTAEMSYAEAEKAQAPRAVQSLRSGFLTIAAEVGASVLKMVEASRHKSVDVLRGYVRRADLFRGGCEYSRKSATC